MNNEQTVEVVSGEKADITLPDGTRLYLNSASSVTYPTHFGLKYRDIFLSGEAYMEVAKDATKPFRVHTARIDAEVLGTTFNISAYPDNDEIETTLLEGSLKLVPKDNTLPSILLKPNEKAIYSFRRHRLSTTLTTGRFETAWMRGELVFRSARFNEIIEKLSKRYGVSIHVVGNKYNDDLFTGSFKEDYIQGVLKLLQMHYHFTYIEQNGRIEITMK
jgi:ferric-dicitrate binding protein FerR (iron transport regulator)